MTIQKTLKVGDIINVKNKTPLLVVRSEHVVSEDRIRGDANYWVNEIDCIKIPDRYIDRGFAGIFEGKIHHFYFEGGCMTGNGKLIKDSDVKVLGTTKLTKHVTTSYEVGKVKFYS